MIRNEPGTTVILTGNEAMARGAMEAGVQFCASYPGSPCVEVADVLIRCHDRGIYGEWSTNEIIALEAAAAASFSGMRSICVMKQNGLAVAADFLLSLNHSGVRGGLVLVVGDDPSAHSSINEVDSRHFARFAEIPLLEPSTVQEACDMTRWAFELSEKVQTLVIIRVVTRICHARGNVVLGELPLVSEKIPRIEPWDRFFCVSLAHLAVHVRQEQAREVFEECAFNQYEGPEDPVSVVVTSGPSSLYAREALSLLGIREKVGILKMGATWPVPRNYILNHLGKSENIIFFEETDAFLEQNITSVMAQFGDRKYHFFGQASGHVEGERGVGVGEMSTNQAVKALSKIFNIDNPLVRPNTSDIKEILRGGLPERELTMCPGCPHRSSFWAIKTALELDGREGFTLGDIGCYTLGALRGGFYLLRSVFCMGSGAGLANGFGQLHRFGFNQPVIALAGDSTFFHACIPALVSAQYNNANFTLVILDNGTTAMTGFQPHAGTGLTGQGTSTGPLIIENITRGLGIKTEIADPHQLKKTVELLYRMLKKQGPKVVILRKPCSLEASRIKRRLYQVNPVECIGDSCGCSRFCSRVFGCPAIFFDNEKGKAYINDLLCTGCGACSDLCPREAIYEVDTNQAEVKMA
ncbi:MAG: indolepyruvate ferredoxin oxidoreductase subunit alpha [Dethiobacter sp.]|jgi:indolepyruvate ferredoxin oxidoreductase alpha subunit|nr:indolepyruvate ferredoxin oxidoreductase subunit alpha [Dethiobacter sp.]